MWKLCRNSFLKTTCSKRHWLRSTALLIQFSLWSAFPASSAVRWPYLPRISYQAERGKCWRRLSVSQDWGEAGSLLLRILPPALLLSQTVTPRMVFFLNPSFCFASFPLQHFLPLSVFFSCFPPLSSPLRAWSAPVVHVSSLREDMRFDLAFPLITWVV